MSVAVDASDATRGVLHVREHIPVAPGTVTLVYPRWIPGEHAATGPIVDLVNVMIRAGDTRLPWLRDPADLYAFHVEVPPGNASIDVTFDFVGSPVGQYSAARLATANLLALTWNKVLLTPAVDDYRRVVITPSVTLPNANWSYATALEGAVQNGASLHFAPVTMDQLVDSPLDAGTNMRRWPLGTIDGAPVDVAVFADTPGELDASDATIAKLRKLVAEMGALYRARHFRHYTFLLIVSDVMAGEGVEHGQSSDNGVPGDFLTDEDTRTANGDLLAHELNHSWNGKYRRPADLATPNLQVPMHDDLLWVYEGMTQFYGDLEAERSGFFTAQEWRDNLALQYADLDTTTGRATRTLADTALAEPLYSDEPATWQTARRADDYYSESELMWLEADGIIRRLSGGRRSIDDVARAFFGGTSTGPEVVTYTRDDVVAAFDAVQPYDWRAFFATRVDAIAPHPPNPFEAAGWRVAYRLVMSGFERVFNDDNKQFDARFSLGLSGSTDGTIDDVIDGSPAAAAGLAPGDKIAAVNGRPATDVQSALDAALRTAEQSGTIRLLVLGGGVYRDVSMDYRGGPRFPALERIPGRPDLLAPVAGARSPT